MKKDINTMFLQAKEELDKITINSEVLENTNKLINDKLDDIVQLDLKDNKEALISNIYRVTRYSHCYITLNYLQSQDVHLSNKIYTLTYCINEILKATNKKIDSIYPNLSDEEKDQ